MKLDKKKEMAARTLKVGKDRIIFLKSGLEEVKEAITKQDIRELYKDGMIIIKNIKGKRKKGKKKRRRNVGKIKKKVEKRKRRYVLLTRKLRNLVSEMKKQRKLSKENVKDIRKKIRNREFKSRAHLKEYIGGLEK